MTTFFISDLHLEDGRPEATAMFLRFLREDARDAHALYLLGDLFEAWVGDDDPSATGAQVAEGLRGLTAAGVPVHFMHGNRDFLLGEAYAQRCGMTLLPDPVLIDLYGTPTLLGHGDLLCTDDDAYQAFRAQTRDPRWQAQFLSQPLAARLAFAGQARAASRARHDELASAGTAETITDVNADAVAVTFLEQGVRQMIHGHTHRPAIHDTPEGRRIVLGDWHAEGAMIGRATPGSFELVAFR